jgi:hypothetical protein
VRIEIEEGSFEHFYLMAVIAFYSPLILANAFSKK